MSYLRPRRWWMWPGLVVARCQSLNIEGQWAAGARCFDLRVWLPRWTSGRWEFAHGAVSFDSRTGLSEVVERIHCLGERDGCRPVVRLILERCHGERNAAAFRLVCDDLRAWYPSIEWTGGFRKSDWAQLAGWAGDVPDMRQAVGSMADDARWWERIVPWLYARRCNRRELARAGDTGTTLVDFLK